MHSDMKNKTEKIFAIAAALIAGIFVGLAGTTSSIVRESGFNVAQVCFTQFLFSALVTGLLSVIKFRQILSAKDFLRLIALGMEKAIPVFTYFLSIQFMNVAAGDALQFQYVWITVLIQCIMQHILPKKWTIISAFLILGGSILGSGLMDEILSGGTNISFVGILLSAICSVSYAVFIYANSRTALDVNPLLRSCILSIGGFISVSLIMLFTGGFKGFDFVASIPGGSLVGLFMCVIPFICFAYAGPRLSGGLTAILLSSELPAAVISGALLKGEKITPLIVIGVIIVLGAIVLAQTRSGDRV